MFFDLDNSEFMFYYPISRPAIRRELANMPRAGFCLTTLQQPI